MRAVEIKKNGGPEVLELQEIILRKPIKDEYTSPFFESILIAFW